jgi:hypothetical protein
MNIRGDKAYPHVRLSRDALDGLMTLTRAEGFFTLPGKVGTGPANAASRFITVRTGNATKMVSGRGLIRNTAFNQLYAVLLAASGVPCSPPRQCGVW